MSKVLGATIASVIATGILTAVAVLFSTAVNAQEEGDKFYIPRFYCMNCEDEATTTLTVCRTQPIAKPGEDCFLVASTLYDLNACKAAWADWRTLKFSGGFRGYCTEPDGNVTPLVP